MKKKYRYQDENGQWVKGFYDEKEIEDLMSYGYKPEEVKEYYNPNDEDADNPYYDISENEVADFMQAYPQAMLKSDYEAQLKKKEQEERGRRESQREYERSSQRTTLQTNINQISLNQAEITKLVVRSKQPGVSPQEKAQIKAQVNALTQQNKSLLESIKPYDEDAYNYGTAAQDQTIQYFDSDWDVNYTQNFWNGYEKGLNYKLDKAGKKAGIKIGTMASDYTERSEADRGLGELDKIHSQVINLISEVKQKSSAGMDANSIKSIYGPKFDKLILDAETFASKLNPVLEEGDKWRINGIVDSIRWYKNNVIGGGDSPGEIFTSKNFDFYIESSKKADNWYNQSRKQLGEKVGIVKGSSKPIESTSPEDLQLLVGDINQYRLSASRFKALTADDLRGYSPEDIEAVNAAMEEAGYGGNPLTEVLDPNYDANKALIAANKTRRGIGANKVVKAAVDDYFDYQMKINPEMAKKQKATYEAYSKMTDLNAYQQGQKLEFERKAVDYATKALVLDLERQKNVINVLNESFTGIDFQAFSSGIAVISKREKEIKSEIDAINKKMQPLVSEFESHKTQVEKEMERLNKLYEEGGIADGMYQSLFNDLQSSLTQKQKELESKIKEITGGVDYQSEINKLNKEKSDLAIKTGVNENVYKLSEQAATEYQNYEALRSKLGNLEYMMQDWDSQYPDYKRELEQNKKIAEFRALGSESELGKALDDAPFWKQALYYGYKYLTPAGLLKETEIGRGFSQSVGSGILGLTQVPEVFYRTFGGDSYTWTTELYDWFQDVSFLRQGEFGDYSSYGYEKSSLDYLTYMGGNVMGSLTLFASGGSLGGTTKLGQTAATFSTSYLTSLGDTYTEMLDVAESNNMSPQWAALQSQAITVVLSAVESMIPDIKYFEPSAARKSILQAIRSGKTVKEAVRGTIEALPDATKAYLKSSGKEGLEEWSAQLVEDTYKSSYNALSGIQYFNDTWNPSAHLESILGGVIGGVGGNFFTRPKGATTDIKVAMYEAAENGQSIIDNAKNEKQKNKLQADMKAPMESFSQLSSHANWEILDKQDRVEAFFLSQQINDIQKKVEENKKNGIQDKASEDKLKEYQDGLNTILNSVTAEQAQGYQQHKQNVNFIVTNIGTEADFGVIEDSDAFKSLNESGQEAITQIRQQMMEVAKTIDETGSEDATNTYAILQKMAGDILNNPGAYKNGDYPWRIVEDTDNEIPMLEDKRGQYISSRMHDLITEDVNRDQAQQIAREEWLKTDDGKRYLLLTQNKDDQKNRKGIPSEEQQGQESVQARSVERTSAEETPAGGVVQGAQEEVTTEPQAAQEEELKPSTELPTTTVEADVVEERQDLTKEKEELEQVKARITEIESATEEGQEVQESEAEELNTLKEKEKELESKISKPVEQPTELKSESKKEEVKTEKVKEKTEEEEADVLFNPSASFTSRVQFMSPEILMAKFGMSANQADAVMAKMQSEGVISEPDSTGKSQVLMKPYQVASIIDARRAKAKELAQKEEQKQKQEQERAQMTPEELAYEEKVDQVKGDIVKMDPTLNDSAVDTAARLFANGLTAKEAIKRAKTEQVQQRREQRKKATAASRVTLPRKGEAIGKPVGMAEAVNRLGQALKSTGINVRVIESQEEFNKLAKQYNLDPNKTEGFFVSKGENPQIIFNKKDLENKYGKTVLFHEGTHPIINIIRNTDPKAYNKLVKGLERLAEKNSQVKKVRDEIKKATTPESFEDEFIVESIAQIASGNIDPSKLDKGLRSSLINWMNKIAKMLGFGQIPINASTDEFVRLANQIKDVLGEGKDISEIVGEKNVKRYERKFVQPRAIELLMGKENLSKYGLEPGKRYNVRQIYEAFEKRQKDLFGQIERNDYSDKTMKQLAEWAKDEVIFMVTQFPDESGTGWYTTKFQAALDEVSKIFPELKTDKGQRSLFTMLVAIYSDGTKVEKNMSNAIMAYSNYKKNGTIPNTDTGGERNASFNANINEINRLIADFDGDFEAITEYLLEEKTGTELSKDSQENRELSPLEQKIGLKQTTERNGKKNFDNAVKEAGISLESKEYKEHEKFIKEQKFTTQWPAEMILPVASRVFGPKLGMFYSNLMGKEGYPTLDRWFSRLFNRYRGDLMPRLTGLKGKEKDTKGELQGVARLKSLIGKPNISDSKAIELAKERALEFGSRTKLGDAAKASKMLSPIEKKLGIKQGADKASKEKFKKAAKDAGIKLTSPEFKAHEKFVKDRTGGFWTELEGKVGFKQGTTDQQKEKFDEEASKLGFGPDSKLYRNHLADKASNTIYKAAFVALNDAPFNSNDRKFMFDTLVEARKMLKKEGVDVTVADIQAILWYYEKKLYVSQGGLESAMGISYEEAARNSVNEYINNGGNLDTEITENDLIDEDGDIDPDEMVQPSTKIDRSNYAESKVFSGINQDISNAADAYKKQNGLSTKTPNFVLNVSEKDAKNIADAYDEMKHDPDNPEVKKGFEELVTQIKSQADMLLSMGYKFQLAKEGEGYGSSSKKMSDDVKNNKRILVDPSSKSFGTKRTFDKDNIGLQDSGYKDSNGIPMTNVELVRAVHDLFGHAEFGNGFGPTGEDNAWRNHMSMFTPLAQKALTTTTRGQNSWVNFGPHMRNSDGSIKKSGDPGYLTPDKRPFAEQKIGFLPDWAMENAYGDVVTINGRDIKPVNKYVLDGTEMYEIEDAAAFHDAIKDAKQARGADGIQVTLKSVDEYQKVLDNGGRLIVTKDGLAGLMIESNGNAGSGFSNPKIPSGQNSIKPLLMMAIKLGARFTDAYDTYLPGYYARFGFKVHKRLKFNPEYAEPGWENTTLSERPDVVVMYWDGGSREDIDKRYNTFPVYDKVKKEGSETKYTEDFDEAAEEARQISESIDKNASLVPPKVQPSTKIDRSGQPSPAGETITENDKQIALYAIRNKHGIKTTKADMLRVSKMSADEKIKLIEEAFRDKVKKMNPSFRDPENQPNEFYQSVVDARDRVLALVQNPTDQKPKAQPSTSIDRDQSDKQNAIDKQFLESNGITDLDVNRWLSDNKFENLLDPKAREKFNKDFKVTLPPLQEIMNVDQLDTAIQSGIDGMGADLDQSVPFSQAFNANIKSKPWYEMLTDNQKAELENEAKSIYAEEYEAESGQQVADTTPTDKASKLVDLWYKKKDRQRGADAEIKTILDSDEKLKYIWNNISPILRQLENKGILTKTAGCP